ncbi:MAG TPA: hypothetical protein VHU83_01260, partial [Bryobacteraceae bacterium]|nr:hypothetical protein [Bryobacteraceae bacterium]
MRRNESPIGFHFDGEPIEQGWSPGAMETVWWLPRATASDYLMLANASRQPLSGSLVVSDAAGHSIRQAVNLGAAETQRLDLRAITQAAHLEGAEGGVTVLVPTGGGNLIVSHIVFDETAGMSATMKTFERNGAEKPRLHTMRAPMMALANPDPVLQFPGGTKLVPQVFLRNTTSAPLDAAASLNWRSPSQSGTVALPEMALAAGATRVLTLAASAGVPEDAYWATVVLKYQGRHGDIVPIATSF